MRLGSSRIKRISGNAENQPVGFSIASPFNIAKT
jgi:hypothetical protein